nr:MAG TPA: hypothetical protein [Caudoviricetes sp.]
MKQIGQSTKQFTQQVTTTTRSRNDLLLYSRFIMPKRNIK